MTQPPVPPTGQPAPTGAPVVPPYEAPTAYAPPGTGVTANGKTITVRPWRESTGTLAVAVQALAVLVALGNLWIAVLDMGIKSQLSAGDILAAAEEADAAQSMLLMSVVPAVLLGIMLLVWFHRVWTSDRSDHSLYTRGTGLAIGGWFIPIANFGLGPLAIRDLLWGTEHASPQAKPGRPKATPRLVIALWVVLAVNVVLSGLGRSARGGVLYGSLEQRVAALQSALTYEILGLFAGIAGGVVLVLTVRQVMSWTRR